MAKICILTFCVAFYTTAAAFGRTSCIRSGEAGVGFAVVAKSMGDLSSQSATIYGDIEKSVIEVTDSNVTNENVRNKALEYLNELGAGKRDFRF